MKVLVLVLLVASRVWALPLCQPGESACERGVAVECLCGGVDRCLPGEYCAGAVKLCPPLRQDCLRLLPTTTSTTTTSTTTTSTTTTTLPCREPRAVSARPTYCGCEDVPLIAEEWEEYGLDEDGGCVPIGGMFHWQCLGQPLRTARYRYDEPGMGLLCPRATLVASVNCGCVSPTHPECIGD